MKIKFVEIQNFRKLKCSRINLADEETLFVGANNSGKTSAMDALIHFLEPKGSRQTGEEQGTKRKLQTTDFTLSNWNAINEFAKSWANGEKGIGLNISEWQSLCPSLDVWLDVKLNEVHRVSHLIPTLKWRGGHLGIRLIYQPKNIELLQSEFMADYIAAQSLVSKSAKYDESDSEQANQTPQLNLWPTSMRDFLDRKLSQHFEIKAYILDPEKIAGADGHPLPPQTLADNIEALDSYPFRGLFKVDIIDAQRGFADPNAVNSGAGNLLAGQINQYYSKHLNPSDLPDDDDMEALLAIEGARNSFDDKLNQAFGSALGEIRQLGYPGFNDPDIRLASKVNPVDSLDHEAAVQFDISGANNTGVSFTLPEKYNGLGYKNLISMVFRLIGYRDAWMRVGKAGKRKTQEDSFIEPLHIVLIEEPEAHLHAQVQQVFIRKAYDVLRGHAALGKNDKFSTQMVVSTHSSHLAHEVDFANLRYFKRKGAESNNQIPTATVIDLTGTFGNKEDQTAKFVTRYLKTTHCDLFFANGVILVEGAAERMLVPHFIKTHYDYEKGLNTNYISILEVGGAHAHRLKPLIEKLGLHTLVITDTDAVDEENKKARPQREKSHKTSSDTLKQWIKVEDVSLDSVLDLPPENKIAGNVRAAYQTGIEVDWNGEKKEAIPYTFEDALALTNIKVFKGLKKPTGMANKMKTALEQTDLSTCCDELFAALTLTKAQFALDLLFNVEPTELEIPEYIREGLDWLEQQLENVSKDFPVTASETVNLKEAVDE